VGIAQQAVAAALTAPGAAEDVAAATATWQQRAEVVLDELADYPCIRPHGGWSLLLEAAQLGLRPAQLSERLLRRGKVAATPMTGWGPNGERYLRIVYANETAQRLKQLGERFRQALR
jgi:aspartate/methionine/tyrosine aminotransferase